MVARELELNHQFEVLKNDNQQFEEALLAREKRLTLEEESVLQRSQLQAQIQAAEFERVEREMRQIEEEIEEKLDGRAFPPSGVAPFSPGGSLMGTERGSSSRWSDHDYFEKPPLTGTAGSGMSTTSLEARRKANRFLQDSRARGGGPPSLMGSVQHHQQQGTRWKQKAAMQDGLASLKSVVELLENRSRSASVTPSYRRTLARRRASGHSTPYSGRGYSSRFAGGEPTPGSTTGAYQTGVDEPGVPPDVGGTEPTTMDEKPLTLPVAQKRDEGPPRQYGAPSSFEQEYSAMSSSVHPFPSTGGDHVGSFGTPSSPSAAGVASTDYARGPPPPPEGSAGAWTGFGSDTTWGAGEQFRGDSAGYGEQSSAGGLLFVHRNEGAAVPHSHRGSTLVMEDVGAHSHRGSTLVMEDVGVGASSEGWTPVPATSSTEHHYARFGGEVEAEENFSTGWRGDIRAGGGVEPQASSPRTSAAGGSAVDSAPAASSTAVSSSPTGFVMGGLSPAKEDDVVRVASYQPESRIGAGVSLDDSLSFSPDASPSRLSPAAASMAPPAPSMTGMIPPSVKPNAAPVHARTEDLQRPPSEKTVEKIAADPGPLPTTIAGPGDAPGPASPEPPPRHNSRTSSRSPSTGPFVDIDLESRTSRDEVDIALADLSILARGRGATGPDDARPTPETRGVKGAGAASGKPWYDKARDDFNNLFNKGKKGGEGTAREDGLDEEGGLDGAKERGGRGDEEGGLDGAKEQNASAAPSGAPAGATSLDSGSGASSVGTTSEKEKKEKKRGFFATLLKGKKKKEGEDVVSVTSEKTGEQGAAGSRWVG